MERRTFTFIALSLAILLGAQALQAWFFPQPKRDLRQQAENTAAPAAASRPESRDATTGRPTDESSAVAPAVSMETPEAAVPAPRTRFTLGSLDPAAPARMLVTLTSRGAAIERIELADEQFHDQDDRGGYLGHLAGAATPEGCQVGVVGPGTPADRSGLKPGDVITAVDSSPVADARSLREILAARRPGQKVTLAVLRGERKATLEAALERRPLEVVRPEIRGAPVADPDGDPHDPLSFRLAIESRDGRGRRSQEGELPGQDLADVDWHAETTADGAVRFTRTLADGLLVVKEFRLAPAGEAENRLELTVEFRAAGEGARETSVAYALDGPTGLPTEGWWYAQRVARDWGSLAVRDVAMRFVGEPTAIVSGLKIADGSLAHPATAVQEGKPLAFAGVDALYFAAALIPAASGPEAPPLAEVRPLAVGEPPAAARRRLVDVTPRLVSRTFDVAPGAAVRHQYEIFAGPKKPDLLRRFGAGDARMDDLVYFGWFGWVARPLIALLHGLHALIGNYGIAIILLTVLVRGAMFPLSRRQAISSQKMQALQPEMKVIADKFKNEPEKRHRATQDLWRKHGVNPVGGCLPVFIQIPIFMGLYRALATDVELRQAPLFSSAIRWCSNLAAPDMLLDWSKYLPAFLTAPEGYLGPYLNLFPIATIALMLWQQKLFMPPAMDEQQRMQQQMMNFMMWFMALAFFKVPCGLCLYFIASSLWGVAERLLWLPKSLPSAAAGGSAATRTVDAVFAPVEKSAPGNGAANIARQKRESRKKQR